MKKFCANCIYESLPHSKVTFPPHTILFMESFPIEHVYRIVDGFVKINRTHSSGEEKVFDVLYPGDYIALLAVLQGAENYIASAETLTETTVIVINKQDVHNAYQSNTLFKDSCLNCAVTRSHLFQNQLFHSTNIDTEEKILEVLRLLANKFGEQKDNHIILTLPFGKNILANIVGIRRETLSRKLSEMHKHGILTVNKNTYKFRRM